MLLLAGTLRAAPDLTSASIDGAAAAPTFRLVVPAGLSTCGVFLDNRSLVDERRMKCRMRLREGACDVPAAEGSVPCDLIESVELGPDAVLVTPASPGGFQVAKETPGGCLPGAVCYRLNFRQDFTSGGERFRIEDWNGLHLRTVNGVPDPAEVKLGPELASQGMFLSGLLGSDPGDISKLVRFASCGYADLPLWVVEADLEGGIRLNLEERYLEPMAGSGPAQLVRGEVKAGDLDIVESSYFRLVYAAQHHNWNEQYWVLFDEPRDLPGLAGAAGVFVQEGFLDTPRRAALLGPDLSEARPLAVLSYSQRLAGEPPPARFRRGEVRADGEVDLSDAVAVLGFLFLGSARPDCLDAADVDDSGELDVSDAISLLEFLFLGGEPPPAPFPGCGPDPTPDSLTDCPRGC